MRDRDLVELQLRLERAREVTERGHVTTRHGRQRCDRRDGDDEIRKERRQRVSPTSSEVLTRGPCVARLLGKPSQTGSDLSFVFGWSAALTLAVGIQGAVEIAGTHAGGRDLAPGPVRDGSLADRRRLFPGLESLIVAIHSEESVPNPVEARSRDIAVGGADRAGVESERMRGVVSLE